MKRKVESVYQQFDDGNKIVVWLVHNSDEVNAVLGKLPSIGNKELHLIPLGGPLIVGRTDYGVINAGYRCHRCKTDVSGGMGQVPFVHRFDYCLCAIALRSPDFEWNPILIEPEAWEQLCVGAIAMAQQALSPRFRTRPKGPNIDNPSTE